MEGIRDQNGEICSCLLAVVCWYEAWMYNFVSFVSFSERFTGCRYWTSCRFALLWLQFCGVNGAVHRTDVFLSFLFHFQPLPSKRRFSRTVKSSFRSHFMWNTHTHTTNFKCQTQVPNMSVIYRLPSCSSGWLSVCSRKKKNEKQNKLNIYAPLMCVFVVVVRHGKTIAMLHCSISESLARILVY